MNLRLNHARPRPAAFTLVELLAVITIIGILASMALMALAGATETARADRTTAEITKLHELVMNRYEGYRERPLPMRVAAKTAPQAAAQQRLFATWELMRMELPERKSDVISNAVYLKTPAGLAMQPALWQAYRRRAEALCGTNWQDDTAGWTPAYQGAECLYLIVSTLRDGDTTGIDFFTPREIGDIDGDKMPEILDAWGNPIEFLRWAPGFVSQLQEGNATNQPDPFDPFKIYPTHFALTPLVYSAGQDRKYDINVGGGVNYASLSPIPNDPWYSIASAPAIGTPTDADGDGRQSHTDNVTNHFIPLR